MRRLVLRLIDEIGWTLSEIGRRMENWAWSRHPRMTEIRESVKDKRTTSMEFKQTPFGREREDLIVEHQRIIEEEKEKDYIKMWVQDVLNDYDELIRKYKGLLPLEDSTVSIPSDEYAEDGREIEVNILHSFPPNCQREDIVRHVTEMIKHVQESYYPDTSIWVEITQHKEKEREK
ncbi:MAG: hypothetical protein QME81_09765 [bacterium]|nr:hypothetical protein [bacterium]